MFWASYARGIGLSRSFVVWTLVFLMLAFLPLILCPSFGIARPLPLGTLVHFFAGDAGA